MMQKLVIESCLLAMTAMAAYAQAPVTGTGQQPGTVEQRLERIERMLQSQGLLDMLQQLQALQREISTLRGEIETQNYNLEQLTRRQRDLYTDIDQRMQRLEGATPSVTAELVTDPVTAGTETEAPPLETLTAIQNFNDTAAAIPSNNSLQVEVINTPPARADTPVTGGSISRPVAGSNAAPPAITGTVTMAPTTTTAPVTGTATDPIQLQAEYQQAFNLLRQSLYDQAIKAFQQFLAAHPNDRYSDSAQYWLAEAYFVKREFEPALAEYNKVVTNFPQSQKVGDAMLKIGYTLAELGQAEQARQQLQALIQKYPETTVARMADERLKQLGPSQQNSSGN
jgi:tol-pal system protein YbgF